MERRSFIKTSCACSLLPLLPATEILADDKEKVSSCINANHINPVLKFVDSTQSEEVKESIFGELGKNCFLSRNLEGWVNSYENVDALIHWVNEEKGSRFWERLEFNKDRSILKLTGKAGDGNGCACQFAEIDDPPKSLCNYCCTAFQEILFEKFIGKKVSVELTETQLLGSNRCSTLIHIS